MKFMVCALLLASVAMLSCSAKDAEGDDGGTGVPSTGPSGEIDDTSAAGIVAFLQEGAFRQWRTQQPAAIASVAAHKSMTRAYFNNRAAAGAKSGRTPLAAGSILVKDMFASDGLTLLGQALMAKIEDGEGGDTWLWFEGLVPAYADPFYGRGHASCIGCHASGSDFVRSTPP